MYASRAGFGDWGEYSHSARNELIGKPSMIVGISLREVSMLEPVHLLKDKYNVNNRNIKPKLQATSQNARISCLMNQLL